MWLIFVAGLGAGMVLLALSETSGCGRNSFWLRIVAGLAMFSIGLAMGNL